MMAEPGKSPRQAGRRRPASGSVRAEAAWGSKPTSQLDDWLAIEVDGSVTAFSGKVELGTGTLTALAQIVAEELDLPLERVHMVMGDTARTPNEGYTAGSMTISRQRHRPATGCRRGARAPCWRWLRPSWMPHPDELSAERWRDLCDPRPGAARSLTLS